MDFIGIIRSLEELLYEVMGWLIFYPRTLWRILVRPAETTLYSEEEQDDRPQERYADTLSPPLLLMITLVITHALGASIGVEGPEATSEAGQSLVGSAKNLLVVRALIFATIPLVIACLSLKRRSLAIDRVTLRMPFYSQCFLLTPFAMMMQGALLLARLPAPAGWMAAALAIAGLGWFLWAQTLWFARKLQLAPRTAFAPALTATAIALATGFGVAMLIALAL